MRLTVRGFALQGARIARVMDYLGAHLDEDVPLARLADLANLSPSQIERLYRTKIGETPMATLRRLRLKRAYEQIRCARRNSETALVDAAMAAGYSSQAAFTRAFVRQFGYAPSRIPLLAGPLDKGPELRLELLPTREVFQMPYSGLYRERRSEVGHMTGNLHVAGAVTWRTWVILDRDQFLFSKPDTHVEMTHFIPSAGQPHTVRNVDRAIQPGGLYAVHEALISQQPKHLCSLVEKIRNELSCQITEGAFGGRIVVRDITVSGYTAPQERRIALYIPVAPVGKGRRICS